jgi:hypothetical protein
MASSSEPLAPTLPVPSVSRRLGDVGSTGWTRWLIPSFADLQFLSVLAFLFALGTAGWAQLLIDGDAGWHIRTGQWIIAHQTVPSTDFFSFTKPGQPWFAWEWLAEAIFGGLHSFGGLKAVVLLAGVIVSAFGALMFQHAVRRGANVFIALPLVLTALGASTVHVLARPHLWTMMLFAASLLVIDRDRNAPGNAIWWLVPLAALWTNLHGGFLALVATLGLVTIGTAVEAGLRRSSWSPVKRYALLTAAVAAASLLNPFGWRLHQHIAAYLQSTWIRDVVSEFQSPSFRSEQASQYEILLLAGIAVCGFLLARGRVVEPLILAFWAHQSLVSARHIPLFCAAAVPVLAGTLAEFWDLWVAGARKNSIPGILASLARDAQPSLRRFSLWAILPLLAMALMDKPFHWPENFPKEVFPVEMIEKHSDAVRSGRVFTQDQWADYLIYRFYPDQRVFFDGRSDFYGPELGKEYIRIMKGEHDWAALLDKHQIAVALVPARWSLASLLKLKPGWRLVDDDGAALLFVREPDPKTRRQPNEIPGV